MISTSLLEGFVQFYPGTWLNMKRVYSSHMGQMYFGKQRVNQTFALEP